MKAEAVWEGEAAIVNWRDQKLSRWVLATVLVLPLASCANSSAGEALQNALAADPNLKETAPDGQLTAIAGQASPGPTVPLPADFPANFPQYPNARLQAVNSAAVNPDSLTPESSTPESPALGSPTSDSAASPTANTSPSPTPTTSPTPSPSPAASPAATTTTTWSTPDGSDRVLQFYREQLPTQGWQIQKNSLADPQGTIVAQLNDLQVTLSVPAATPTPQEQPAPTETQFAIAYTATAANPSPTPQASLSPSPAPSTPAPSTSPQTIEAFLGAEGTLETANGNTSGAIATPPSPAPSAIAYTDLEQAPQELQRYVKDLARLGVLSLAPTNAKAQTSTTFAPNKPVSRREYARWLFAANNQLYADQASQQIRPGNPAAQPAFRDIPPSDPDYAAIQGLAEAGIIPSSLSGNPAAIAFRPDAQLSREEMLLWKVPMDTRQPLPTANLTAVQQAWGFQDAAKIAPQSQRAVLADYQNGDLANIRRVFGYTTLFQPQRPVTRAEAAASLWYFGYQSNGVNAGQPKSSPMPASPTPTTP